MAEFNGSQPFGVAASRFGFPFDLMMRREPDRSCLTLRPVAEPPRRVSLGFDAFVASNLILYGQLDRCRRIQDSIPLMDSCSTRVELRIFCRVAEPDPKLLTLILPL